MDKSTSNKKGDSLTFEQWMEKFFLDPFTSYLDESEFRIDVYETSEEYIVEALLQEYLPKQLEVEVNHDVLTIKMEAEEIGKTFRKKRTIRFPFYIYNHSINAFYDHGILEVKIKKTKNTNTNQKNQIQVKSIK
jgi:spore coat protein M